MNENFDNLRNFVVLFDFQCDITSDKAYVPSMATGGIHPKNHQLPEEADLVPEIQ